MNSTTSAEIENWLHQLASLRVARRCASPNFMKPFHLATLAHALRHEHADLLNLPEEVASYADTMSLWSALDGNSCEIATEYGITGKPGEGHSGYGLAVARRLIEQNGGVLCLRSGHECFYLSSRTIQKFHTKSLWKGTLLVIEWDLAQQMDIGAVYASFPLPEGMDDDDFDF